MKNSCVIGFAAASAVLLAFSGRAAEPLVSEVKPYGGVPTLWIDGRPSTGCMFWSGAFGSDKDIEVMRNAGVHIYSAHGDQVFAGPGWFAVAAKMPGRHRLVPRRGEPVELEMKRGEVRCFEK